METNDDGYKRLSDDTYGDLGPVPFFFRKEKAIIFTGFYVI